MLNLLSPFRERNYRLYATGQAFSLTGYWVQSTTCNWLLYQFTDSTLSLGYLSAAITLPTLLLLPIAGLLVDRFDRRRLLIGLQSLFVIQALVFSTLTYSALLTLPLLVLMGSVQGVLAAFDGPARQAFVPTLIRERTHLPAAISSNSIIFNLSRAIGPPLAGWTLAQTGPAPAFLLNAVSYLLMMGALLLMHIAPVICSQGPRESRSVLDNLRIVARTPSLRYPILSFSAVAVAAVSVYVLLPIWANDILRAGPQGLGWMMGALGGGALLGAALVGMERRPARLWRLIRRAAILLSLALILLAVAKSVWMILALTVVIGFAYFAQGVAVNTLLQLGIDDDHRAGVMAFYLLAALGSAPIGNLLGGWLGQWFGPQGAAFVSGIAILSVTALLWRASHRAEQSFRAMA
jgi:MFS family permease